MEVLNRIGLGFIFTAKDLASSKIHSLEKSFTSLDERTTAGTARMNKSFRALGVGLGVLAIGAVTLGGTFALAGAAGRFEQGIAAVGAVTRATTTELDTLRDAAIEAGVRTQFSPDEAVEGLTSLATAGQTAQQATRTLIPVLDLAAGSLGQLGVAGAAEAVVGTLNAYGMQAEEATGVTDKLLRITQLSNFQTRDFSIGLSKAAATGATFNQNLDDVLITMGLLRNRNIDASSAATAFREAVRRVGSDQRAQTAITSLGIKVFDQATGRMRSITDIMTEFADRTRDLTDEERNRRVVTAFGARGLLAFNSVMNALATRTLPDGTRETLRGAEAINYMRQQMGNAAGTAESFKEKLLDTFEGQKTLLRGTLQTFAIVLGEPFAKIFKPIVKTVTDALNWLLRAFNAVPEPIKRTFAGFVVTAGAVTTLVGAVIAAKAAVSLLLIGLKALGITLGGILSILLPAILAFGALVAVVKGFGVAFRRNIGGLGDFVSTAASKIKLAFQGLAQLFSEGGFSGAVRKELNRAENQGLKRFLINVFAIVHRIQRIWEGFKEGFKAAIEAAAPVFQGFADSLRELGNEIGGVFGDITKGAAALPGKEFQRFGAVVGGAIATVVKWFVVLWTFVNRVVSGILDILQKMMEYIGPAFKVLKDALIGLIEAWNSLWDTQQNVVDATEKSTITWRMFAKVLATIVGGAIAAITLVLSSLIKGIQYVIDFLVAIADTVRTVFNKIGDFVIKLLRKIPDALLPTSLEILKRTPLSTEIRDARSEPAVVRTEETRLAAAAASGVQPAAVEAGVRGTEMAELEANIMRMANQTARQRGEQPPFVVNVQVDGETVAQATHKATREAAARSFSGSVPAMSMP